MEPVSAVHLCFIAYACECQLLWIATLGSEAMSEAQANGLGTSIFVIFPRHRYITVCPRHVCHVCRPNVLTHVHFDLLCVHSRGPTPQEPRSPSMLPWQQLQLR